MATFIRKSYLHLYSVRLCMYLCVDWVKWAIQIKNDNNIVAIVVLQSHGNHTSHTYCGVRAFALSIIQQFTHTTHTHTHNSCRFIQQFIIPPCVRLCVCSCTFALHATLAVDGKYHFYKLNWAIITKTCAWCAHQTIACQISLNANKMISILALKFKWMKAAKIERKKNREPSKSLAWHACFCD